MENSALGMVVRDRKRAVNRVGNAVEGASRWLWLRREEKSWKPTIDTQWTNHPLRAHHHERVYRLTG